MHSREQVINLLNLTKQDSFVDSNLIFLALSGSHAYGLNNENSDYDYRGICIPPLKHLLTISEFNQREDKINDITIYSLIKFFKLAKTMNPNIVELLFVEKDSIVYSHPIMDRILENRDLFLSKKAEHSFSGYAFSQLKRMKGHKKWIDNPLEKPLRKSYNLPTCPLISQDKIRSIINLNRDELKDFINEDMIDYVLNEVRYVNDKKEYDRYVGWIENRNPKRAELERKFGIDLKHSMHLIRLLRMAREIAEEKTMHTRRPDKDFLLDIRNGKYSYEEILEIAEKENKELKSIYEKSDLPYSVNVNKIDDLLFDILIDFYNIKV